MSKLQIFAIFALINIVVVAFASAFWVRPVVGSLRGGMAGVRLLERRYAAERRFLAEYDANKRELEEILLAQLVLGYHEKIPALAEISRLDTLYGLENLEFGASQVSVGYLGENRLFETRVNVEYLGAFADIISFLHEISESDGKICSFSVLLEENARLRLEFSMFGGG
ncbi:MAG: hypothetical protein FWE27_04070 [Defluviitaleaceae bacterium]|nr:hypothetical protein [Defluviitaleaceae bacterium]